MPDHNTHSGMAALSICEAMLLALNDAKILPQSEISGILKDAAAAHENASGSASELETHKAIAELINNILLGGSPIRRGL